MDRAHQDEPQEHASIGNTQLIPRKQGLFDGLSAAQIIAAAAAAATAHGALFAHWHRRLGDRRGVSSVVTVVSSQLYRNFLDAGARKLKDGSILPNAHANSATGGAHAQAGLVWHAGRAVRAPHPIYRAECRRRVHLEQSVAHVWHRSNSRHGRPRIALKPQRRVVVFSLLIAVIVLGIYVAVLLWGTAGEGLGTRPEPLFTPTTQAKRKMTPPSPDEAGEMPTTGTNAGDNANCRHNGRNLLSQPPSLRKILRTREMAAQASPPQAMPPQRTHPALTGTASDTGSGTGAGTKNSSDAPASASAA